MRPGWAKEERERLERSERRHRAPTPPPADDSDLLQPVEETLRQMREQDSRGWTIDVETGERWSK